MDATRPSSSCAAHHGFCRRWFYRWKSRWEAEVEAGMRSRKHGPETGPNAMDADTLGQLIEHVETNPVHGCDRMALELEARMSAMMVQRYLQE